MPWGGTAPNQTYSRTDGVRSGSAVNVTAETAGINNTAALADARENDLAAAINLLLLRNGGNAPTANLPMNSHKLTGMAQGSARTDSLRIDQVQDGDFLYASVSGTANAIGLTMSPVSSGPVEGMLVLFIPSSDNTGAVTIDLDSDGAAALELNSAALAGGELQAGQPAIIVYDGTNWQLVTPAVLSVLARTVMGQGASLIGVEDSAENFAAANVEAVLAEIIADYAATTTGNGASKIGIEDSADLITANTVEGALAENRVAIDAIEAAALLIANNLSDVADPAAAFGNIKQVASTDATGVVELATNAEAAAGSDTSRATTPSGVAAAIAVRGATGSIVAWPGATAPAYALECDGSGVSRTTYAALFAIIGEMFGNGDGSTTFNLPDLRGEFIRGWDHGAGNDVDAASRTDRGDGVTSDNVGTRQGDAIRNITGTVADVDGTTSNSATTGAFSGSTSNSATSAPTGSNSRAQHEPLEFDASNAPGVLTGGDNRPRNVAMMWIIWI